MTSNPFIAIVLTATTLSGLVAKCENGMDHSLNMLAEPSSVSVPSGNIDQATYRSLTSTFYPAVPAPGHGYPATKAQAFPHAVIEPLAKDDRIIDRWLYRVDTGLAFILFVENDRVIGYEISFREGL